MLDTCQENRDLELLRRCPTRAVGELFRRYRPRLLRMIQLRLDSRVLGKVDAEDILQDVFVQAARRVRQYLDHPSAPFFIWLRQLAYQQVIETHRRFLGARRRDVRNEVALPQPPDADRSTPLLIAQLADSLTTPSQCAMRVELLARMKAALDTLPSGDREVLLLRHVEGLGNNEAAHVLGLGKHAASKRYVRALDRLRVAMAGEP